jgi:hypothetical protein
MRAKMEAMQRQMEEFVTTLNQELADRAAAVSRAEGPGTSLIPVLRPMAQQVMVKARPVAAPPRSKAKVASSYLTGWRAA